VADDEIEGSSLAALIGNEIAQAQTFDQTKRTLAIEYMRGEMNDVPARTNGSSQTSRDVADTIQGMLPMIVRVFAASDQMVNYESTQPGGEQGAEEASELMNYGFFRENDGYRILYNATYDALVLGNGAVCSYWCPEQSKTQTFRDKTEEEIAYLFSEGWQGNGSLPKQTGSQQVDDPNTGQIGEVPTYTVKLKQVTERGYIKDQTLKPENLLLNANAVTIEEARFCGYLHDDLTRSDLMAMADEYGWDKDVIENLPRFNLTGNNQVDTARKARQTNFNNDSSTVKSGDIIDLYRCFMHADEDGDGEAELLEVWYAGNAGQGEVLSSEEWDDDIPYTDIPCYPVPHMWQAESVFDRAADVQRVKTILLRQAIDNLYAVNNPMLEVEAGTVENPDILVNKIFGGIVWRSKNKNAATSPITPHVTPFIADKAFLGLQYMDDVLVNRTGMSRTSQALDPDVLQNQTATAAQQQHDAGISQVELVARNMAEMGWSKVFSKRRKLAKKYLKDTPVQIPSRNGKTEDGTQQNNGYRTIQVEQWQDQMACTINVGLGTGSRDRDMSMLSLIMNGQIAMADRLGAAGFKSKAIEFVPKIRKTAVEMAEASGLKNPDDYYPPISDQELQQMQQQAQQPPPPDPALQVEQLRGQNAKDLKQVDAQVQQHSAELKAQGDVVKNQAELQADLQTGAADRETQILIEQMRQQTEAAKIASNERIEADKLAASIQLERERMVHQATIAANKPKPNGSAQEAQPN